MIKEIVTVQWTSLQSNGQGNCKKATEENYKPEVSELVAMRLMSLQTKVHKHVARQVAILPTGAGN